MRCFYFCCSVMKMKNENEGGPSKSGGLIGDAKLPSCKKKTIVNIVVEDVAYVIKLNCFDFIPTHKTNQACSLSLIFSNFRSKST